MTKKHDSPGALGRARRADVIELVGKIDTEGSRLEALDLQVHRLTRRYAISIALALAIAEHAFSSGRRA